MARGERSNLQADVLAILGRVQPATVRQIVERLEPPRAFTTVATVLGRMLEQKRVTRKSVDGLWVYSIALGHNRQLGERIAYLLERAAGDPEPLLQALVGGVEQIDPDLLDRLEALIAERKGEPQ